MSFACMRELRADFNRVSCVPAVFTAVLLSRVCEFWEMWVYRVMGFRGCAYGEFAGG